MKHSKSPRIQRHWRIALFAALTAACSTRPSPAPAAPEPAAPAAFQAPATVVDATPASAIVDHEGDSPETAVAVPAEARNEGIDFQNDWLFDRYGRFRRIKSGLAHAGEGSAARRYEVVTIEVPDHSHHTVFFDITENEKNWDKQRAAEAPPAHE